MKKLVGTDLSKKTIERCQLNLLVKSNVELIYGDFSK